MMTDTRKGRPSASQMFATAQCSGKQALVNALRRTGAIYEVPSVFAQRGTLKHHCLAEVGEQTGVWTELTSDEQAEVTKCLELRQALIEQWKTRPLSINDPQLEFLYEERFWFADNLFSGQLDFALIDHLHNRAIIIDYKTGRLAAAQPEDNLQLRTLAVLLKYHFPHLTQIDGAIVEPWVSWEPLRVSYNQEDLARAETEILTYVAAADFKTEERIAGSWCRYCPANNRCPEARQYVLSLNPDDCPQVIALPTGEAGADFWRRLAIVESLIEQIRRAYTRILEDQPDALPGYILPTQGRARRRVIMPAKFKEALSKFLSPEEIDGCADYRLGKIEELLALKGKLSKAEAERKLKTLTKDLIAIIHEAPFIRPLTKKERETRHLRCE